MQSLPEDEPVSSEDILSVAEYADIHQHLRESEVSNFDFKHYGLPHLCFLDIQLLF